MSSSIPPFFPPLDNRAPRDAAARDSANHSGRARTAYRGLDGWRDGRVIEKRNWTESLFSLRIAAPTIAFEAGQFVRLGFDVAGEVLARAFSLVNPPSDPVLEFLVARVPGGALSPRLAALEPGDGLRISERASGSLVLSRLSDATVPQSLWLIATGTGLAPFLSILATEAPWQRFRDVVLVHGARHTRDLVYRERIDALGARRGLRSIRFVSREPCSGALAGRVPAAIRDGRLEAAACVRLVPESSRVLLCGNPAMIEESLVALAERGVRRHRSSEPGHVLTESYG